MRPKGMRNTNTGSNTAKLRTGRRVQAGAAVAAAHLGGCSPCYEPPAPRLADISGCRILAGSSFHNQCKHLPVIPECRVACRQGAVGRRQGKVV